MIVWDVYSTKTFILNKEIHHPLLYFKQNLLIKGGLNIIYIYKAYKVFTKQTHYLYQDIIYHDTIILLKIET